MPVFPAGGQPTDILTLAEAKQAINWTSADTGRDALIGSVITATSTLIDNLAGPVVTRTVTESWDGTDAWQLLREGLQLHQTPVSSVTTVTEYNGTTATVLAAETNTAKTGSDYLFDPVRGTIRRRSNGNPVPYAAGGLNVTVTYVAGRYASTATCSPQFKAAAQMLFAHLWRSEHGAGNQTFGAGEQPTFGPGYLVPNRVKEALYGELKPAGFA